MRYNVEADTWTTVGQVNDGDRASGVARGNIRAGNKFYLAGAHDEQLAEFDPMTETYQVINKVRIYTNTYKV